MAFFAKGAATQDPQGNELNPEDWSDDIFTNSTVNVFTAGMSGSKDSRSTFIMDQRLTAEPGDEITYTFVPYADTPPILGNETSVKSNVDKLTEFGLKIAIHPIRFGYGRKGIMTQQRTLWNIRSTSKSYLMERNRQYTDQIRIATASGVTFTELADSSKPQESATDTVDRVNGANRCIRASGGSNFADVLAADSDNTALVASMSTSDKMNTKLIEEAVIKAHEEDTYKMTPISRRENGDPVFVLFMSLQAARDLREDPVYEKHALARLPADLEQDPFAKGAFGMWDNVILKRTERIIRFGAAADKHARNILFGAEAVVELFGALQADFTEEIEDHNNDYTASTATIRGENKVTFNGEDINVMQVITASN